MSSGNCETDHSDIELSKIIQSLPNSQKAENGRHKCSACAYSRGFKDGEEAYKRFVKYAIYGGHLSIEELLKVKSST